MFFIATHWLWGGAAAVDEGVDRGGVIDEVGGHGRVGELIGVLGDQVLEVGRNLLCLAVAHALSAAGEVQEVIKACSTHFRLAIRPDSSILLMLLSQRTKEWLWGRKGNSREGRGGNDEGTHLD
jgi:hypothetical protein